MTVKFNYGGHDYDIEIASGTLDMDHAMVGETLVVDTLKLVMITEDTPLRVICSDQDETDFILTSDGYVICALQGGPEPVFQKNSPGLLYFNDDLVGKYYMNEMQQTALHRHEMYFYSAIKTLSLSKHYGGLYESTTLGVVIDDVIGDVVDYTVDEDVAAIDIDIGYLPIANRRDNLQSVLMAYGAHVRNASDGSLRIMTPSESSTGTFGSSRVFYGGSVTKKTQATAVQVTEHNFIETSETETLYENTSVSTETITFSEPYYDYQITNGSIVTSGVNFVTFTGSGSVTITGKKYIHITRVVTHGTEPSDSADDVVRYVTDNTMICPSNAADVAENLYDYLTVAQSITQKVIVGTERPADVVSVLHPYTLLSVSACIKNMYMEFSPSDILAVCEFLVGYVPPGLISGFTNYVLLTSSGNWEVPAGCTKIRAIIVGAGQGGYGGNGGSYPTGYNVYGPAGNGGSKGSSGKIFEVNLIVTPASLIAYSAPSGTTGGAGGTGATTPGTGSSGASSSAPAATTFGSASSDMGRNYPYGYYEPKSGLTFAMDADEGVDGGDGGGPGKAAEDVTYDSQTWTGGANYGLDARGGGAAVGSNGEDAYVSGYNVNAGDGADANDGYDASHYGEGGGGGHGGGGGGAAALQTAPYVGYPGDGGDAGDGGDGYAGCIVVYY